MTPTEHALQHIQRAKIAREGGDLESAVTSYRLALAIYRELDLPDRIALTLRHIGDILVELKRFEPAGRSFDEALAIYRANPKTAPLELANAVRGFAVLKTELGETDSARALWKEARKLYQRCNIEAGVAECNERLRAL